MARREREAPELGGMMERMLRAMVRRAADGDVEALEVLWQLDGAVSEALTTAGQAMHAHQSWTELGELLGISRQAARQRFYSRTHAAECPSCSVPPEVAAPGEISSTAGAGIVYTRRRPGRAAGKSALG